MTKRELEPEFQTESPEPNPKPAKKVKSVTSQDASQPKKRYIVFVGNLPYTITKDDLESHFSSYGTNLSHSV